MANTERVGDEEVCAAFEGVNQVGDERAALVRGQIGRVRGALVGGDEQLIVGIGAQVRRAARAHDDEAGVAKRGRGLRREPVGGEGRQCAVG